MALLEMMKVSFAYSGTPVVVDLDLEIDAGQIVSVMGPSGCGKSTVLRLLSGLETPDSGECRFDHRLLDRPSTLLRFAFQDFDAFPWRTVRQNLILGGAVDDGDDAVFDVVELIERIGLTGHEDKYPAELSAGMRKRLGLGRCLAGNPKVILLDEPFSSLDVDAKEEMYELLQTLWSEWHCLFVIVTHDIHEAILLSQQVVISEPLPFRVKRRIDVPFEYPRSNAIASSSRYISLSTSIRDLLQTAPSAGLP